MSSQSRVFRDSGCGVVIIVSTRNAAQAFRQQGAVAASQAETPAALRPPAASISPALPGFPSLFRLSADGKINIIPLRLSYHNQWKWML
jgi:hypothetical protein